MIHRAKARGGAETPIGWGGGGGVAGHVNESAEQRRLEGFKTMGVYVSYPRLGASQRSISASGICFL